MTQRERVLAYLTEGMDLAFWQGRFEDAQDYLHLRAHFLELTDDEYERAYAEVSFIDG